MSFAVMFLALVLGIIVEQAAPFSIYIGFAKPPVLICVVAYYALNPRPVSPAEQDGRLGQAGRTSPAPLLSAAFIGGILSDSVTGLPLGISSVIFAVAGVAMHHYRDKVFSGKSVTNVVFGATLGLSMPLAINAALLFFGQSALARPETPYCLQPGILILKIIGSAVMGALLFPVIHFLLERLELLIGTRLPDPARPVRQGEGVLRRFYDDLNPDNRP